MAGYQVRGASGRESALCSTSRSVAEYHYTVSISSKRSSITCSTSYDSSHTYRVSSTVLDAFQRKIISTTAQFRKAEAKIVYFSMSMLLQMLEITLQSSLFTSSFKEVASMTTPAQLMPEI